MKHMLPALLLILVARPAFAQAKDVRSMDSWMEVTVVHYKFVAEFKGEVGISGPVVGGIGQTGGARSFAVTDRFEIEFDYHDKDLKIVGRPVITNFPSTSTLIEVKGCPPSKIDGSPEVATASFLKEVEAGGMVIGFILELKQDTPAGTWGTYPNNLVEGPCTATAKAPAESTTTTMKFSVVPGFGMILATFEPGDKGITADGKSVREDKNNGWVITITPTPVK